MSPAEIFHRTIVFTKTKLEKLGFLIALHPPAPNLQAPSVCWFGRVENGDSEPYCKAAGKILAGNLDIFDLKDQYLGNPTEWNRDPLTEKLSPMVFGKTLDYRDEKLVGDIKYLWEPSRHLHFVTLAQAYHLTKSDIYLEALQFQLTSWFDQCPYLMGPQWVSSLELGIRLINWYLVWQLIGGLESDLFKGARGATFRDQWLSSIYQHVHFIDGHYSKYSSANNHLIGEAAGVFIATTGWPFWPKFKRLQKTSARMLERETILQNTSDGVNREQAIAYQQFVLDFLLLSKLTADANQFEFSGKWLGRVESMLEFAASIMDVAGNLPMIGDADDGFVVDICKGDEDWSEFRSLLATGAVLFKRPEFSIKAKYFDDKSRWLLGDKGFYEYSRLTTDAIHFSSKRVFAKGGYYILGDSFESRHEVKIIADVGPLGYLDIAAHGHADALSFILFAGGKEVLIDPGTYTYHTRKKWRDYFRGTSSHNTVRIDGQNQSVIGGNFMWLCKAKVKNIAWNSTDTEDCLTALHDGYARFSDPVFHKRSIRYIKSSRKIIVTDTIECKAEHSVELFWHFSEHCELNDQKNQVTIRNDDVIVNLKMEGSLNVGRLIVSGDSDTPLGWVSRRFGVKVPTSTVVFSKKIYGETVFHTEIDIKFDAVGSPDLSKLENI